MPSKFACTERTCSWTGTAPEMDSDGETCHCPECKTAMFEVVMTA